jgi:hypothetical protein
MRTPARSSAKIVDVEEFARLCARAGVALAPSSLLHLSAPPPILIPAANLSSIRTKSSGMEARFICLDVYEGGWRTMAALEQSTLEAPLGPGLIRRGRHRVEHGLWRRKSGSGPCHLRGSFGSGDCTMVKCSIMCFSVRAKSSTKKLDENFSRNLSFL